MQNHNDRHRLWTHALAIYGSFKMAFSLRTSIGRADVPRLIGTPVIIVSAYIQKFPNVTGVDISKLDAPLVQAPMRMTPMGVDPKTKQASLIIMSSFAGKLGNSAR